MKKIIFTLLFVLVTVSINSQNIFGKWHSKNDDTGEIDSVIEVYEKDGKIEFENGDELKD